MPLMYKIAGTEKVLHHYEHEKWQFIQLELEIPFQEQDYKRDIFYERFGLKDYSLIMNGTTKRTSPIMTNKIILFTKYG